jgi:hypothetical protein
MKFGEARTTGGAALLDSTNGEPGWSTEAEENGRRRGAETTVGDASPVTSGGTRRRTNGDALYGVSRRKWVAWIWALMETVSGVGVFSPNDAGAINEGSRVFLHICQPFFLRLIFVNLRRGVAGLVPLSVTHVAPHVSDTCFDVLRKNGKYVNVPGSRRNLRPVI